jgi:hypothetical protein
VYVHKGDRIEVQDHPIRKNFWISYPANTESKYNKLISSRTCPVGY